MSAVPFAFRRAFAPVRAASPLLLAALLASSTAGAQAASDLVLPQGVATTAPTLPARPTDEDAARAARDVLLGADWLRVDPTLAEASGVDLVAHRFGARVVVRAAPRVDGVPVEGADRVVVYDRGRLRGARAGAPLARGSRFVLDEQQAILAASQAVRGSVLVDPTVEDVRGLGRRVWLADGQRILAAWRVRVPTYALRDLSDVWVDAESGRVLRTMRVARFVDAGVTLDAGLLDDAGQTDDAGAVEDAGEPAADAGEPVADAGEPGEDAGAAEADAGEVQPEPDAGPPGAAPTRALVFAVSPDVAGVDEADLIEVELAGLLDAHVGGFLRGGHFETYNCCKHYVCADGAAECELPQRRCATDDDVDPIESTISVEVDSSQIPVPIPLPNPLYARAVLCSELPRVTSRDAEGARPAGWFETPVDALRTPIEAAGLATEEDAFAEVQVYYQTSTFFSHVRDVLQDQTFCLGGASQTCDESGAPVLVDGKPERPFHIATNVLLPEVNINDLGAQLLAGRGASPDNPIIISDYQRIDNAAFVPALEGGPIQIPPELQDLAALFNRPYDSNIYFQGRRDFAYDASIVRHEFTHALVHAFQPNLLSIAKDDQGSHSDPGSMNEGWADYFAASSLNDTTIGAYGGADIGEGAIRDVENDKKCPDDITGEVHDDSEHFSAALWDIREAVIAAEGDDAVATLDRALMSTIALAEDDETKAEQSARIVEAVREAFGDSLAGAAQAALDEHGVSSCVRVIDLVTLDDDERPVIATKDLLLVPSPEEIGVENMAPAFLQAKVTVPPGSTGFTLKWVQGAGGVGGFTGQSSTQLSALVVEADKPIAWRYDGARAIPVDADGQDIDFDPAAAANKTNLSQPNNDGVSSGSFDVTVASDPCEARTFFVHFVSIDDSNVVGELTAEVFESEAECESPPPPPPPVDDCQCGSTDASARGGAAAGALAVAFLGLALARRRRR